MPEETSPLQGGSKLPGALEDSGQRPGGEPISFVKEALKWQYNVIGLAGAAVFALVSGTALPLVLAAGLELIYLSVIPPNPRFQRLVRSWQYAEEKRRTQMSLAALFQELPPAQRARYTALDSRCRAIRANYSRLSSTSQIFVAQVEDKLQGLLHAYLRLLNSAQQHRESLKNTDPAEIKEEIAQLQHALETDPPKVQEINRRRIEILTKRLEKFEKMGENSKVIDAQCAAIEDVLELMVDQSVTMRDPQQVSDQLGNLVRDVEQTEETVQQVEAIFELAAPEMGETLASSASSAGPARSRQRS
jgi:hypothetical protein